MAWVPISDNGGSTGATIVLEGAVGGSSWSVIAAIIKENTVVDGSRNCMDRSIVRWSLSLAGCGN